MYGYVHVPHGPAATVRRLSSGTVADRVDDVTVVWVARKGSIDETYVIGWFEHCTVYSGFRDRPYAEEIAGEVSKQGIKIEAGQEELQYFLTCREEGAQLLPESERAFPVPMGGGWMGQSFLFYPDGGTKRAPDRRRKHEEFKGRLLDYIATCTSGQTTSPVPYPAEVDLLGVSSTVEGRQVLVTHAVRERNSGLVRRAKEEFRKDHGRLFCEACRFDFQAKYGPLGKGFIEAHHLTPLREGPRTTSLNDLMMLCANCHRMVHQQMNRMGRGLTRDEVMAIATGDGG